MPGPRPAGMLALVPALGPVAWMAGAGVQLQQPALWSPSAYLCLLLAGLCGAAAAWRARGGWRPAWLLLCLALLAAGSTGWRGGQRLAERLDPALEGQDLVIEGRVADMTQVDAEGLRFAFSVESARWQGRPVALPPRLWLAWSRPQGPGEWTAPAALAGGEAWRLPVRLRRPHGLMNPAGFDAELWLFEQRIGAAGSVQARRPGEAQRLGPARAWVPTEVLAALRQRLRDQVLLAGPDGPRAGVLAALAVGDQSAIDGTQWDLFRQTGVAHLMSISGLHITLFAWLAAAAVGALWRRWPALSRRLPAPSAARWGGLLLAAAYAALAGWGVPAQRTVGMLALGVAAAQAGWRWPPLLVCAWAGALVSAADPWALLQPGFWLSFLAVALLLSAGGSAPAQAQAGWPGRWRQVLREAWRAQWLATLGLAPLAMIWFQQFSLVGLLANALAVPLVTWAITPLALAGLLWAPAQAAAAALVQPLLAWLAWLGSWPQASWAVAEPGPGAALLSLAGGALLVWRLPWWLRGLGLLLCLPLLWPALPRPAPGQFQLLAADVGQGSAVLVRTRGHALLHDAGPRYAPDSDAGQRVLWPLLRALGQRQLDELVLSHRDQDHVGGAATLLARLPVGRLRHSLEPGHPLLAGRPGAIACAAGQRWTWDGVVFEVLHPEVAGAGAAGHTNAASCVLRVSDALGRVALLSGDIEAAQEAALVERLGEGLRATWLIVPHHGSRTSSSAAFLAAVAPRVAVIQVGYRSRFGHPHPEVLARYQEMGISVVRTDACGAWQWDDAGAWCTREVRRRYWQAEAPQATDPQAGALVAKQQSGEPE